MNTTLNKVIHFQGSEANWKRNISNGIWKDCIVFGLVRNEETYITTKRIYGGRDGWGAEYEYKSTITVASIQDAEYLLTDSNIGLLVNIVNSSNLSENGSYIINYNSNGALILQKIGESNLDASIFYTIIDASNRIFPDDPSALAIIDRSAEGVKVKVTEIGTDSSLKFGIDLDSIYLPHGVQRTEAIGVLPASDEIVTEGVGMSVKELLEYYLLKEKFPEPVIARGGGNFTNFGITVSGLPQTNVKSYISINGNAAPANNSLVEIGSQMIISPISGELVCSRYGMQESVTSTISKISNLNFGYCTELGDLIPNEENHYQPAGEIFGDSTINGEPGIATATYTVKDTELTITSTLSVKSINVSSYSTISKYSFDQQQNEVTEGNNIIKLSLEHDASASRVLNDTTIPGISMVYVQSNKKHVCPNNTASVSTGTITGSITGEVNSYSTSSYNVIGVYPIFTNGKVVPSNANLSTFDWYNNTYSTEPVNKLDLVNYLNNNQTYLIAFGATNTANSRKCYMYVPHNMSFTVPMQCQIDSNENIVSWKENTMRNITWLAEGTTIIQIQGNDVIYDVYTENTNGAGNWTFKVQINKK